MMESRRGDLVGVLNTLSNGKDLKWCGDQCCCPFCEDKSRSAGVHVCKDGKWRFTCHQPGCDIRSQDLTDLLCKRDNVSTAELIREGKESKSMRSARSEGVGDGGMRPSGVGAQPRSYQSLSQIKKIFSPVLVHLYGHPVSHAVLRLNDTSAKSGKRYMQCHKRADGTWVLKAPAKPWILYNSWRLNGDGKGNGSKRGSVFIVEGEKNCDRVTQAGFLAVSSMGGAGKAKHGVWDCLAGRDVYLWRDNDVAGEGHAADIVEILRGIDCKLYLVDPASLGITEVKHDVVNYLDRFDSSLWHQELGAVMAGASPVGLESDYRSYSEARYSGAVKLVPFPFPALTEYTQALLPGTVTVLCAPGGSRKSFFMLQCLQYWQAIGVKYSCMMMEGVREYHMRRMVAQLSCDARLTDLKFLQASPENVEYAKDCDNKHMAALLAVGANIHKQKSGLVTLPDVTDWCVAQAEAGVRVICVDPVTFADKGSDPVWVADKKFVQTARDACERHGCSLLLVSHPKQGQSKTFNMDSMAGGAAFQQNTDCIIWIESLGKPKDEYCLTACGRAPVKVDGRFRMMKTRNGGGANKSVGYCWAGGELKWAEQGLIL